MTTRTSPDRARLLRRANPTPLNKGDLEQPGQIILAYRSLAGLRPKLPELLAKARTEQRQLLLVRLLCMPEETGPEPDHAALEVELRCLTAMIPAQQSPVRILVLPCASLDELHTFARHARASQLVLTDDLMQAHA